MVYIPPNIITRIYNSICNNKHNVIICYATFLCRHLTVEDGEADVAYSRLIAEDLTARYPLPVVGPAQSAVWPNVLAAPVFPSSVPYCSLFLQIIDSLVKFFFLLTHTWLAIPTKCS